MAEREGGIAVFVQKVNDFVDNTTVYRKSQEEIQKRISDKLESNTKEIMDKLSLMNERLLKLPCDAHQAVADKIHENIKKEHVTDSQNQWVMIGCLWAVVGFVSAALFNAWMKLWGR